MGRNCLRISSLRGNLQLVGVLLGNVLHKAVVLLVNLKRSRISLSAHNLPPYTSTLPQ